MIELEVAELYEYQKKKKAIMLIMDTLTDYEKNDVVENILKKLKLKE